MPAPVMMPCGRGRLLSAAGHSRRRGAGSCRRSVIGRSGVRSLETARGTLHVLANLISIVDVLKGIRFLPGLRCSEFCLAGREHVRIGRAEFEGSEMRLAV